MLNDFLSLKFFLESHFCFVYNLLQMKKWLVFTLILIIVGSISEVIFLKKQEKKKILVTLGSVARGELSLKVRARARIEAKEKIEVKAKRGGVVTFILEEGTKVKEGETIAFLDNKELLSRQKEQEAQLLTLLNELNRLTRAIDLMEVEKRLEEVKVSYAELHRQFLTAERLFKSKVISEDEFKRIKAEDEKAKIASDLQNMQLQEAKISHQEREKQIESQIISVEASLSFIAQQLSWLRITSPISGIVIYKVVKKDTFVQPSQILLVVASTKDFVVKSEIDETEIDKIALGMKAQILPDAFSDKTISGTITRIAPSPTLRTKINAFEVTVKLEKTNLPIKSEMLCDLVVLSDRRDNVLKVAYEAILSVDKKNYVFIVENNIALKKEVSLGLWTPNEVEVLSGVKEKEKVILNPPPGLKNGARIRLKKLATD